MKKSIYISLLILAFGGGYFLGNNQFLTRSLYTKTHGAGDHIVGTRSKNVTSRAVQKKKEAGFKKYRTEGNFQSATYCPNREELLQEPPIPPHEISDKDEGEDAYLSTDYVILQNELFDSMVEGQIPEEDIQNVLDGTTPEENSKDVSSVSAQGDLSAEEVEEELRKSLSEEAGASPEDIENMVKGFFEATRMQEQEDQFPEGASLAVPPSDENSD